MIEHWDGRVWKLTDSPGPNSVGSTSYTLVDVSALSVGDIWAVGRTSQGNGAATLVEHWNGLKWRVVPSPNTGYPSNALLGVETLASDDVWAAGYSRGASAGEPLAIHWDGATWSVVPTPARPDRYVSEVLWGVSAVSPSDVWAVGHSLRGWEGPRLPLALHWDGVRWTRVPVPNPWEAGAELNGVAAISSDDVWAVGARPTTPGLYESIIQHWDGVAWNVVPTPHPGSDDALSGIVAVSASNVFAVGYFYPNDRPSALVMHWSGSEWRVMRTPNVSAPFLHDIDAVAPAELWAVGDATPKSLAMRFGIPFCADGVDNDGDGAADYPGDAGCKFSDDGSEFLNTACDNGYDDDNDGVIDHSDDPGCSGIEDGSEHGTIQCDDGRDNDLDGREDYHLHQRGDPQCSSPSDVSEAS